MTEGAGFIPDSAKLPFRTALGEAIGCNAPGEHPECDVELDEALAVCREYYGYLPGEGEQSEDAPDDRALWGRIRAAIMHAFSQEPIGYEKASANAEWATNKIIEELGRAEQALHEVSD